jgi:hypothetical protein
LLSGIIQVLTPFAELTDTWQAEFGNLGTVLPSIAEVRNLLNCVKGPISLLQFAQTMAQNFDKRFNKYYDDIHLMVAAVLDPRLKTEWILRDTYVRDKIIGVRELVAKKATEAYLQLAKTSTRCGCAGHFLQPPSCLSTVKSANYCCP